MLTTEEIQRAELIRAQAAAGYVEYAEGLPIGSEPLVITRGPLGLAPGWVQSKHTGRARQPKDGQ